MHQMLEMLCGIKYKFLIWSDQTKPHNINTCSYGDLHVSDGPDSLGTKLVLKNRSVREK